jgi:hypothetical protein
MLRVRDANTYAVVEFKQGEPGQARGVIRDETGWHCSIHPQATENFPVF